MTGAPSIRLIRHATLTVHVGGNTLLVDPMLSSAGSNPPIENTPNDRRNPLVDLPAFDLAAVDAVLVTHMHTDHFDEAATEALSNSIPIYCQPPDTEELEGRGFRDVRPVEGRVSFESIGFRRTPARHGYGDVAEQMAPVSGYLLEAPQAPTIYLAGDTVWYPAVAEVIETNRPDVIVLNAGGARFTEGRPITMTDADVAAVCDAAPDATVIAVHMEAINHCLQSRSELSDALEGAACDESLRIPADGDRLALD